MPEIPLILTSNSAYGTWHSCQRRRWWAYEALSDSASGARGWERQRLSLPLSTGGWCHRVAQGFFTLEIMRQAAPDAFISVPTWDWVPEGHLHPTDASGVISAALAGYCSEARERGLDLGLQMDGSLPEEKFVERTIAEQAALLEAFGWAFLRVRLPRLLEEYELLDVEREEYTLLSGDVGLQSRCDAVLRRRSDQRLFIYNLKTSGNPDKRWKDSFEVDAQLMTETLAVERRLGERVYGVIIDGFDKGVRVELDFQTLKERPKAEAEKWVGQRSRLIYGYKCEDIPGRPTLYDYEGTTRKGWGKFAVWEEAFAHVEQHSQKLEKAYLETFKGPNAQLDGVNVDMAGGMGPMSSVEYWVNWIPQEQVEAAFVTLPPIMRSDRTVESAVRQMVSVEQQIRVNRDIVERHPETLDAWFPQNFRSCVYPSRCAFYELCHGNAADDPASNGFQPRTANHPLEVE